MRTEELSQFHLRKWLRIIMRSGYFQLQPEMNMSLNDGLIKKHEELKSPKTQNYFQILPYMHNGI